MPARQTINSLQCPRCQQSNRCAMAEGNKHNNAKHCWCMAVELSADAKPKLSGSTNTQQCFCKTCLTELNQNISN